MNKRKKIKNFIICFFLYFFYINYINYYVIIIIFNLNSFISSLRKSNLKKIDSIHLFNITTSVKKINK